MQCHWIDDQDDHPSRFSRIDGIEWLRDMSELVAMLNRWTIAMVATLLAVLSPSIAFPSVALAERFVAFYPAAPGLTSPATSADLSNVKMVLPSAAPNSDSNVFDDATLKAWQAYCDSWRQFHQTPDDVQLRKRLSVSNDPFAFVANQSSSALTSRMPLSGLKRYDSAHFQIYTDVDRDRLQQVIVELEQYYAVWTQLFFPLWNQAPGWIENANAPRLKAVPKHRVVLFADTARYQEALKHEGDVVAISTGFYSDLLRISFFCDEGDQRSETIYHELTHQLLLEATSATGRFRPGERAGFWLVEGIAAYMESVDRHADFATIGGWESPRLQFARQTVLGSGVQLQLAELQNESRSLVQRRGDLGTWYSHVAAYTHAMIDSHDEGLDSTLGLVADMYQIRRGVKTGRKPKPVEVNLVDYLQRDNQSLDAIASTELRSLCLTGTTITDEAIQRIPSQTQLKWLDAGFLPLDNRSLQRLVPEPRSLTQLNLESTKVDDRLGDWIATATELSELDLSNTQVGDNVIASLSANVPLQTLWLTGSKVTDASLETIAAIKSLQRVDLQVTGVTPAGMDRLKMQRPDLTINPLQVRTQ